jgi:hypothetical protein
LRVRDGIAVTTSAPSRSSACYQQFLAKVEAANRGTGDSVVITGNLSSHNSYATRGWPAGHPRIRHAFIPVACWLNLALARSLTWMAHAEREEAGASPVAAASEGAQHRQQGSRVGCGPKELGVGSSTTARGVPVTIEPSGPLRRPVS